MPKSTRKQIRISLPRNFNFWATVYSHGWCALPPFRIDKENRTLSLVVDGKSNRQYALTLHPEKGELVARLGADADPSAAERSIIAHGVSTVLRLDESFDLFYKEARRFPRYRWVVKRHAGRLLRSGSVFEDVVKMVCTTNCSWALTETMIEALVTKLGVCIADGVFAFPTPAAIASRSESSLRKEIRCGYRAPYLLELSRRVAEGSLKLEGWRTSTQSTEELFEEVRSIKGVGEYAAGNILKLLGRYDYLGLDSWTRGKFYELFKSGRKVKDSTIEKHYAQFGSWRGLFMWMDMTKEWYEKEFPL